VNAVERENGRKEMEVLEQMREEAELALERCREEVGSLELGRREHIKGPRHRLEGSPSPRP
jgi:hypothetical protein